MFPALDADVTLSPAGEHATALILAGVYRLPPRTLGDGLAVAMSQRIATATIRAFLGRLARTLAVPPARHDQTTSSQAMVSPGPSRARCHGHRLAGRRC